MFAFVYSNGTMKAPYGFPGSATGINKSGQVVGAATTGTGATNAFLYSPLLWLRTVSERGQRQSIRSSPLAVSP